MEDISMKQKIAFGLLFSTLLLAACGTEGKKPENTTDEESVSVSDSGAETRTTADEVKDKYGSNDYGGYTFRILGFSPGEFFYKKINTSANEIYYEEDTGDVLDSAVVKRNQQTEQLLNIEIKPVFSGSWTDGEAMARKSIASNSDDFDAMLITLMGANTLAGSGLVMNLNDINAIDTSNIWWDQNIVENFTVNGKLYALTGAYNVFDDYAVPCIFYNQYMAEKNAVGDLPQLVRDGKWTIDTMTAAAKLSTLDVNGDSVMDKDDSWGFMDNGGAGKHLFEGCDLTFAEKKEDGSFGVSLGSAKAVSAAEKLYNLVINSDILFQTKNAECVKMFSEDRCMFYYELLGAINEFRNMDKDFGVLPLPKYDENQSRYTAVLNNIWCTALAVPSTTTDAERTGTVLETLAGFSVDTVNQALYGLVLGSKLVRDETTVEMLDYVFGSKTYDFGNGFSWSADIQQLLNMTKGSGFTFASRYAKQAERAEKGLNTLIDSLS